MSNTIFVYVREGFVKCLTADQLNLVEKDLEKEGWVYSTAIQEPTEWIEKLCNGTADNVSDMLDELQFVKER
jgi:hypothetical protein